MPRRVKQRMKRPHDADWLESLPKRPKGKKPERRPGDPWQPKRRAPMEETP